MQMEINMNNKYLFFSCETTPPAGDILSKIFVPIEKEFNAIYSNKNYSNALDSIGIIPICCSKEWLDECPRPERKYVSRKNRYADFRLHIDFEEFVHSDEKRRIELFTENVHRAIDILSQRIKDFDKDEFLLDFDRTVEQLSIKKNERKGGLLYSEIIDERFLFITQNCPDYIGGIDVEESGILFSIYETLPLNVSGKEKESMFAAKLRDIFGADNNCYPDWIESAEWPLIDGAPMRFLGQTERSTEESTEENEGAVYVDYLFEDEKTGEKKIITQIR